MDRFCDLNVFVHLHRYCPWHKLLVIALCIYWSNQRFYLDISKLWKIYYFLYSVHQKGCTLQKAFTIEESDVYFVFTNQLYARRRSGGSGYTSDYYDFFLRFFSFFLSLSLVPPPLTTIHSHTIIITIIALGRLRERLMSF